MNKGYEPTFVTSSRSVLEGQFKLFPLGFYCIQKKFRMTHTVRNEVVYHLLKNLEDEGQENSTTSEQERPSSTNNQQIVIKKVNKRAFRPVFKIPNPLSAHHVYKLFNTYGVNQTALQVPNFEESFMRTYYYHRVVTRVEKYRNAVMMTVAPINEVVCQPPINYFVDKLKSQGRIQSFELGELIEDIWKTLLSMKSQTMPTAIQEDKESITKYLNECGDDMFMYKFGIYKMAISNSLINYMGYDVDEFATEVVKYRTVLVDFLSSNGYHQIVTHALKTVKNLMRVDLGEITLDEYIELCRMEFKDFIYTRDFKKSYCDLEYTVPTRGTICIRVKKILYQTSEVDWKLHGPEKQQIDEQKDRIKEKEYELLNSLGVIPGNWLKKREQKVAGYKSIIKPSLQ